MTRVIRSRRAGLSRDESRQQPLYARLLGLQYLTPSGFLCFMFLEGAVALGVLLALAELVSWWGVLVLPVTVAAMVKLNDVVAGALSHPATPAVRSAGARTGASRAGVPPAAAPRPAQSLPAPVVDFRTEGAASLPGAPVGGAPDLRLPAGAAPGFPGTSIRPPTMGAAGNESWTGEQWTPEAPAANAGTADWTPSWAPEWTAESPVSATRTRPSMQLRGATDAAALNGPPATRQWSSRVEPLDDPEQRARQAASRRYE